jgi:hypothetical protein
MLALLPDRSGRDTDVRESRSVVQCDSALAHDVRDPSPALLGARSCLATHVGGIEPWRPSDADNSGTGATSLPREIDHEAIANAICRAKKRGSVRGAQAMNVANPRHAFPGRHGCAFWTGVHDLEPAAAARRIAKEGAQFRAGVGVEDAALTATLPPLGRTGAASTASEGMRDLAAPQLPNMDQSGRVRRGATAAPRTTGP